MMRKHRYVHGQHVRYAEDGSHGLYWPATTDPTWGGGYDITELLPANHREPQYRIRSGGLADERIVGEGQICEDQKRGVPRSTDEFFLLWAKMNVTVTGEVQVTWTSFVSALEAELSRKNSENHQLRQTLAILRDREMAALQQAKRVRAQDLPVQRADGEPVGLAEIAMVAHAANRVGLWIGKPKAV
jgi:hypothetical protein